MNRFTVSPAARGDLRSIWMYTAERWSAEQADRYITSIEEGFRRLAARELRGRAADEFVEGYLRFAVGSHFIFYRFNTTGTLEVMRVLHQRMNLPRHLRNS